MSEIPRCPSCGAKFPGEPCNHCGLTREQAVAAKPGRQPRKKRKHGRR